MTESNRTPGLLKRLFGEPLVSFALIGGLLFAIYSVATGSGKPMILVSQEFIDTLVAERELIIERKLTEPERVSIGEDFVDQEVLVREAMSRRLYLNDGQVRHRLADKMYYLLTDDVPEPSADDIESFYQSRRHFYRTPELISFDHRYFGSNEAASRQAYRDKQFDDVGQAFYMGLQIYRYAQPELIPIFGPEFTRQIGDLPVGEWQGPIESGRGWHLVKVRSREPQADIPRAELENRLVTDWRSAQLAEARRRHLDALRGNYRIVVTDSVDDE